MQNQDGVLLIGLRTRFEVVKIEPKRKKNDTKLSKHIFYIFQSYMSSC